MNRLSQDALIVISVISLVWAFLLLQGECQLFTSKLSFAFTCEVYFK